MEVQDLPALNASLNGLALILILWGGVAIHKGKETLHKRLMLSAYGCSLLFLVSYLYYHAKIGGGVHYSGGGLGRSLYLAMLASHVVLAAVLPVLTTRTIWLGLRDRRVAHRRWARWTFPIWIYVSLTGVLVYVVLYHLTDSAARTALAS